MTITRRRAPSSLPGAMGMLLAFAALLANASCGRGDDTPAPATPAAKVSSPVKESTLSTITLTAEAAERLGIETAPVQQQGVIRSRTIGGEVMPAGGAETTVTAPFAGTLDASATMPVIGATVARGTTILRLVPLAQADRDVRIEAQRALSEAEGRQTMAQQRADRAARLAKDGSGSRRAAEEATADLVAADAALTAARERLTLASRAVGASGAVALNAPYTAMLRAVHAGPGQAVAAAAPLFDLVRLDRMWIRVPLYAGDIDEIDRAAPARVVPLGADTSVSGQVATPVAAPPSADASTAAVDLYYALTTPGAYWRPGQRVSVRLPLRAEQSSLVVPHAALLHDAQGGAWVYEAQDGHVFVRRRVSVTDVVGDMAVLDRGPAVGTQVVTVGAAELFGTEFGTGK